ncbi:MAG: signal peptidase II [Fretibacterium sp.]|nr:signal peptidase II [Fretibacterium sp.]
MKRFWPFVFFPALGLDLLLKAAAYRLPPEGVTLLCGFRLALHVNPGAAFGLAQTWGAVAGLAGLGVLAGLTFFLRPLSGPTRCALALLWAGGASNALERAWTGGVTDFLLIPLPFSSVFGPRGLFVNLADVWLALGALLLALICVKRGGKDARLFFL